MKRRYFTKHLDESQLRQIQELASQSDLATDIDLGEKTDHDCAIVFFDLCNFTNISWSLPTSKVMTIIQDLFQYTSEVVTKYQGMIDKYPGDGVVAFFPRSYSDDEDLIVEAALDCISEVMYWFYHNMRWKYDLPKPSHTLELSVGVDAGSIAIAHVGSVYHSEIILLGDSVNCASKCQQSAGNKESVIGQDAARRVRSIYSKYFSTGPNIGVVYTRSNERYLSYRFDWESFAVNSSWIKK